MHAPVIKLPAAKRQRSRPKGERRKTVQAAILRTRGAVVVDLFCGAGSLSAGARDAMLELGFEPQFVAVNHWDIATQTYAANHPGARVHCVTLDAAFPMELVPEGVVDLLLAGIECTFFSRARGGRPVNDQQRMSAWHVLRWATELRIKRMLLENVPEFVKWGPVDHATGKPIKEREGEYFRAWKHSIESIGGVIEMRVINCAEHGDPTTRQRLLIIIKFDGSPITWPKATHSKVAGALPRWRSARECIDWSIPGRSIFDRPRPLAPKTLLRIWAGILKFQWPLPFIVVLKAHADARGIDLPLPTVHAGGQHFGLVEPIGDWGEFRGSLSDPDSLAALTFLLSTRQHTGGPVPRAVDDPCPTATATDSRFAIVQPFMCGNRTNNVPKDVDQPLGTNTTNAGGGHFIVSPFVLSQASGGAPRSTDDPVQTIPNGGAHALVAPYYSSGSGQTCQSADDPLPTATTKARFGLVMPVTHNDGSNRARDLDQPLPTLTTANRGELAFLTASFGEREGQAPRVHSIDAPSPTICAQGRINLVEGEVGGRRPYDILFRMFQPHELAAAMSISRPGAPYHFIGNKTQVVRQIGQAVPYFTAKAHVREVMAA